MYLSFSSTIREYLIKEGFLYGLLVPRQSANELLTMQLSPFKTLDELFTYAEEHAFDPQAHVALDAIEIDHSKLNGNDLITINDYWYPEQVL